VNNRRSLTLRRPRIDHTAVATELEALRRELDAVAARFQLLAPALEDFHHHRGELVGPLLTKHALNSHEALRSARAALELLATHTRPMAKTARMLDEQAEQVRARTVVH